jgi:hypothetical protein
LKQYDTGLNVDERLRPENNKRARYRSRPQFTGGSVGKFRAPFSTRVLTHLPGTALRSRQL